MTSNPLVRRTFATLRSAEFGFLGVVVYTRVHTPRFCGDCCRAGTFLRAFCATRGLRINWLIVGIVSLHLPFRLRTPRPVRRDAYPSNGAPQTHRGARKTKNPPAAQDRGPTFSPQRTTTPPPAAPSRSCPHIRQFDVRGSV